jgi:Spy/CpxP family protein refolding chaperone
MRNAFVSSLLAGAALLASAAPANPYAGQQTREIKALSAEEVQNYLSGKGMGLARAAELNGYPGPAHVKSLASDLGLSAQQSQQTDELFARMASQSAQLGRQVVEEERALDALFASRKITPELLAKAMARIGELQGQVRLAHLSAHIDQVAILTPAQRDRYMTLRGYADDAQPSEDGAHHHHH